MIKQYRKKPVVIEAVQFTYDVVGIELLKQFCKDALLGYGKDRYVDAVGWAKIGTLEDGSPDTAQVDHIATEGDYVIKGVRGEFYPVKQDIFEATYEVVK